ncbi:methyl-CpG-binding domain protein 1 isoform X2 [Clupea harengus]|uniref:Methyl-CpG-binding domain protein 1 isoform X2 n=1 Tax=Clupea harengus TaxID=7950 RepID=A0A6P8FJJ7_CLUHA|nr:methyl-CpG-binding domain protein 1 isoform X2 [Clupea harengus]
MDEEVLTEVPPVGGAADTPMASEDLQPEEQREEATPHTHVEQREEATPHTHVEQREETSPHTHMEQRGQIAPHTHEATEKPSESGAAAERLTPAAPADLGQNDAGGQADGPPQEEQPPEDWLEPLDEDDFEDEDEMQSGSRDGSVSGSMLGVERSGRGRGGRGGRRPRLLVEEDWDDWPGLGQGWKRKEVFRRSGCYAGKSDTYYMSPSGVRLRSKVELAKCLSGSMDLGMFDFKSGHFLSEQPPRKRRRWTKRKDEHSPSLDAGVSDDSSHPADDSRSRSPDSLHRVPLAGRSSALHQHAPPYPDPALAPLSPPSSPEPPHTDDTDTQDCSTNGDKATGGPPSRDGVCCKCGGSFAAVAVGQTLCPRCRESVKGRRNIVFRKWIPCGQCRACQNPADCGVCASCRSAVHNPGKAVRCRKRKCLCPIRKAPFRHEAARASLSFTGAPLSLGSERRLSQDSDSDEYLPYQEDEDEDDEEEYDEDGERMKRKRRTCGKCEGCRVMRDCGTCDFCVDKPKFGGSNKKRQKCRRRQCTRQAMLGEAELAALQSSSRGGLGRKRRSHGSRGERWEFEFSDNENEERSSRRSDSRVSTETRAYKTYTRQTQGRGTEEPRSPRVSNPPTLSTHQTPLSRSRQNGLSNSLTEATSAPVLRPEAADVRWQIVAEGRKREESVADITEGRSWSARETETSNGDALSGMEDEDEDGIPMITQIYSLADNGVDLDGELLGLLEGLRAPGSALPALWLAVLGEGPVLRLLQCLKSSPMADTVVRIGPGLGFSVSVQEHPLVPTHPLYAQHPPRMRSQQDVLALLRDLEGHAVCQGLRSHASAPPDEPLVNVRVATCDFLVPRSRVRCSKCRYPVEKT